MDSLPFGAENCATDVVNCIVRVGGNEVEQRHLNKKSFPFARDAGIEAALCGRAMCNPNHEKADEGSDWELEDEVHRIDSDNWIRMSLPRPSTAPQVALSRAPSIEGQELPGNLRPRSAPGVPRKRLSPSSQNSETSSYTSRSGSKLNNMLVPSASASSSAARSSDTKRVYSMRVGKVGNDDRAFTIPDLHTVDEDDEKMRAYKSRQEKKKIEEEEKERLRLLEEEAEERRKENKRLQEVQDTRPRTYDSAGKIIWIQEPDPEELPNIQAYFDIDVETSPHDRLDEIPQISSLPVKRPPLPDASAEKKEVRGRKPLRRTTSNLRRSRTKTDDFPDGFYRHECMQPPLTETMKMRGGVRLQCMGVTKSAPLPQKDGQRMSRAEYLNLIERRDRGSEGAVSVEGSTSGSATPSRKSSKVRPQSAPMGRRKSAVGMSMPILPKDVQDSTANIEGEDTIIETIVNNPCPPPRIPLYLESGVTTDANQKVPPAPAAHLRGKERSLTGDAQPRNRGIFIGCVNTRNGRTGPIQPPLGATMGHGLLHSVSQRDAFYFPHFPSSPGHTSVTPSSPPSARIRTASEPAIRGRVRR